MSSTATVFPMNGVRICVDEYSDDLSGRVYSKMMLVPLSFSGCSELLLSIDDLFDQIGYPQAFQVKRSFLKPAKLRKIVRMPKQMMKDEEIDEQRGNCGTFDMIVQSRRQNCWQGILVNPKRTSIKKFRSELELLDCICSRLENSPEMWEGLPCSRQYEGS